MSIASEHSQRKLSQAIIGDQLVAEMGACTVSTDHGEEIREVPFVYFPNLIAKIAQLVSQHERQGTSVTL